MPGMSGRQILCDQYHDSGTMSCGSLLSGDDEVRVPVSMSIGYVQRQRRPGVVAGMYSMHAGIILWQHRVGGGDGTL